MKQVQTTVTYFAREGRENLPECLRLSFEAAVAHALDTIVIFTAFGAGVTAALQDFKSIPEYSHIKIVAVTFPVGFGVTSEGKEAPPQFPESEIRRYGDIGVPFVRAHMPFEPIQTYHRDRGILAQDLSIVGNALGIFGGSMSLCVQAVLMACDAGEISPGEHVVVLTSDTSLIVRAAPTSRFLSDLIIRQLICKPAFLTIGKKEKGIDTPVGTGSQNDRCG